MTSVVSNSGYPTSTAVRVGAMLQVGGTLGALCLAWLTARCGFFVVLMPSFVLAAVTIAMIGSPALSLGALYVVVFVTGVCILGSQAPVNALSGSS